MGLRGTMDPKGQFMSYEGHVAEVEDAIQAHVQTHHLGLSKDQIALAFEEHYSLIENGRKLDMLVDDYFGEPVADIDGEVHRAGGTKEKNERRWAERAEFQKRTEAFQARTDKRLVVLEHHLGNGGVPAKVKLSRGQWIALVAAVSPILAASISVLLGNA